MVRMPHWPVPLWHNPINLGLERTLELLAHLGNPHLQLPPVVHVAGTNGKGSTIAFLRAILEAAGYKVHVYTSPHLIRFNERIRLAGSEISDEYLYEILEECRIATEQLDLPVTFFEGTTVAAFLAFSRHPADIILLETGLGGRLDATNVVPHPALTILTPIGMDHMQFLGNTIAAIAYEKACIMKKGTPSIVSMQLPEAEDVFERYAALLDIPLIAYGYDWGVKGEENGIVYQSEKATYHLPFPNLPGEHQWLNSATAITAALYLEGFTIREEAIRKGITSAYWPARLQQLHTGHLVEMLPSTWELWIDGAHNEAGSYVLSLWTETKQDRPLYVIAGMTRGRDSENFFKNLAPYITYLCGIVVEAEPSSQSAEFVAEGGKKAGIPASSAASLEEAIHYLASLSETPARILICGSLYLAGYVLEKNST